jgi:hypothetical protein
MKTHKIDLIATSRGDRAQMSYRGTQIGESHMPLLEAARWLLREGRASGNDLIETYRGTTLCLRSTVEKAAGLAVMELASGGCRFVKFTPVEERLGAMEEA